MERFRSWLFSPADVPERCLKALATPADQVIWDLEDAVAPAHKRQARDQVRSLLDHVRDQDRKPWVRVNGLTTTWGPDDLMTLQDAVAPERARWMVPKVDAETITLIESWIAQGQVRGEWLFLIETARGLWDLSQAQHRWLDGSSVRLTFGALDYQADLAGDIGPDEAELLYPRSQIVVASRAWGWPAPVDAVYPAFLDQVGLDAAALRARRLGFAGKMVIHPNQVHPVNRAFSPTDAERIWAERVVSQMRHQGVAQLDGQMLDRPVVERAKQVLQFFDDSPAESSGR